MDTSEGPGVFEALRFGKSNRRDEQGVSQGCA